MTNERLKVMTVVGTRPEVIRLSRTILELDRAYDHVLVHTGQNYDYELNGVFFKELGLRAPDHVLEAAGNTPAQTVAAVISGVDSLLEKERPDALLILGDTNSALSSYAAKRRKIPVFHMEAGNRCLDERVPEEINRRIVDHTSDMNLVYSDRARDYLIAEGLPLDRIVKTGSPMFEVLAAYRPQIEASTALADHGLERGKYFVVSCHREENLEGHLAELVALLHDLAAEGPPVIFSVHPRTAKRLEQQKVVLPPNVRALKPLGFFDYIRLQKDAKCVLSDSGTISEESAILDFPAVNIRETHERLEAMDDAAVIMSGLNALDVRRAVALASEQVSGARAFTLPADYTVPNVSKKVVRIILSYTPYVNSRVWRK